MDREELKAHAENLAQLLNDDKDVTVLEQFQRQSDALHLLAEQDLNQAQNSIRDCTEIVGAYKEKSVAAGSENAAADAELSLLQKKLEDELEMHRILMQELSGISSEIKDLEQQGISAEEHLQAMKKVKQDDLRAEMKLSMYASVTNVIPCLDDENKISGHVVHRDKNVTEKFQFYPSEVSVFDTCNNIWKMIKLMECKYSETPAGHANSLSDHLNQLKDPNVPPSVSKTGRGRGRLRKGAAGEEQC